MKSFATLRTNSTAVTIHIQIARAFQAHGRTRQLRTAAQAVIVQVQLAHAVELSIRLSDDAELHALNLNYRSMDKPTDVLSFGSEAWRDGVRAQASSDPEYLGDIVISMERCVAQAQAGGHEVHEELALLVVHGTLHLLGYDHDTPPRKKLMWGQQAQALAAVGIANRVQV